MCPPAPRDTTKNERRRRVQHEAPGLRLRAPRYRTAPTEGVAAEPQTTHAAQRSLKAIAFRSWTDRSPSLKPSKAGILRPHPKTESAPGPACDREARPS